MFQNRIYSTDDRRKGALKAWLPALAKFCVLICLMPSAWAATISDSFDSGIAAFWTVGTNSQNGLFTAVSTSGCQVGPGCLQLGLPTLLDDSETSLTYRWANEQVGYLQVLVKNVDGDTGLFIQSQDGNQTVELDRIDYPSVGSFHVEGSFLDGSPLTEFTTQDPYGWHEVYLSVGPGGTAVFWDQTLVDVFPEMTSFSFLSLIQQHGGEGYFDDFSATFSDSASGPGIVTPEPVTASLCFLSIMLLVICPGPQQNSGDGCGRSDPAATCRYPGIETAAKLSPMTDPSDHSQNSCGAILIAARVGSMLSA